MRWRHRTAKPATYLNSDVLAGCGRREQSFVAKTFKLIDDLQPNAASAAAAHVPLAALSFAQRCGKCVIIVPWRVAKQLHALF